MSYDIDLVIDTGAGFPASITEVGNYTSNVAGIWAEALGFPLADLDGKNAGESVAALDAAIAALRDPERRAAFERLEPDNGWGDLGGALNYIIKLACSCRTHPKTTIRISR